MNSKKVFSRIGNLSIVFLFSVNQSYASISADATAALNGIQSDSTKLSQWVSDQFKVAIPYNSTSGAVVPSQLKIFGFEVGVEGVASATKMDVDGLHHLGTQIVDTTKIDVFNRLPMPSVIGHAKIGLPFGLDAGIRVGGLPSKSIDKDDTKIKAKNKIVGIDVRKALIEDGLTHPFGLTVGVNYTHADGEIDLTTPLNYNSTVVENGHTYDVASTASSTGKSEWKTNSYGFQALLHKKILFLTPYIGASVNRNSGNIDTSMTTTGNVTLTDPNNAANTTTQSIGTLVGLGTASAEKWDNRLLAGLEIAPLPFFRIGLNGEYSGTRKLAGALGLRFQFR